MAEKVSAVVAIMRYFKLEGKEAMAEIKPLSTEDRKELGALAAKELGLELA